MIYTMTYSWHKLAKTFFTLGLVVTLLMGFSHMGMAMGTDGKMSMVDCPFMNGGGICNMTPLEHGAMWQSLFTNVPQQLATTFLLLLLVSALTLTWTRYRYPPPDDVRKQFRSYSRRDHVTVYVVRGFHQTAKPEPNREIAAHGFFPADALPADTNTGTRARIAEVLGGTPAAERW